MSLFVQYDNQTILWEAIQRHPYVNMIPPAQRGSWFKHHIQSMYEHAPSSWFASPMTTETLNRVNQQAMQHMVNDLKMMVGATTTTTNQPPPRRETSAFDLHLGEGPSRPPADRQRGGGGGGGGEEFKNKTIYDQFLQKQQDIESMLQQNNTVTPIDFTISEVDAPITNIDELIQRQLRDRELDVMTPPIHHYIGTGPGPGPSVLVPPPPSVDDLRTSFVGSPASPSIVPKQLEIHSDINVLELDVQEIKHVNFVMEDVRLLTLEERLQQMEEQCQQMKEQLNQHDERIHVLEQIQVIPTFDTDSYQEEMENEISSVEENEP